MDTEKLYGIIGSFDEPHDLVRAARKVRAAGYARIDAYTPYPVHGLARAIGFTKTRLPMIVLIGGILGCLGGFGLQYWVSVIEYPLNIGGRPLNSWPAFLPVTFETTILAAALFAVLGMLALNGLPRPHHPLFAIDQFDRVARDGFFLCVEATDRQFDAQRVRQMLREVGAKEVIDVPVP